MILYNLYLNGLLMQLENVKVIGRITSQENSVTTVSAFASSPFTRGRAPGVFWTLLRQAFGCLCKMDGDDKCYLKSV